MVMAAFAYYKAKKFPEAITQGKRYATMHPGTKEAPLAHHIVASSYFEDMNGPNRDQSNTRKALEDPPPRRIGERGERSVELGRAHRFFGLRRRW